MQYIFPDYYQEFQCIADQCRHNCCIGWEIDIDDEKAAFYRSQPAICEKICWDDQPHFILGENERCPFLTDQNLCQLIINYGEDSLCGICADHPRFRNELPGRVEVGLGLACEEAARLILGRQTPMKLTDVAPSDDEIIQLRDEILLALQDPRYPLLQRIQTMLALCQTQISYIPWDEWIDLLISLERLDPAWTQLLQTAADLPEYLHLTFPHNQPMEYLTDFDRYMADRQHEYQQFLVYLIYRHFANAYDREDAACRALFAGYAYQLLRIMGAVIWHQTGAFTFEQQVELARMFSAEIEYSDENLDIILDELAF